MKEDIRKWIEHFVEEYQKRPEILAKWEQPLVQSAQANHPYIQNLPALIPGHQLPEEVLPGAVSVLVYYVPFTRELARTNRGKAELASEQWARTYEETNAMFRDLNEELSAWLRKKGVRAAVPEASSTFDQKVLMSRWSHRHLAYAAGLGTFGMNNMLITSQGCCGRFFSLVTDLRVEADTPVQGEYCLYKQDQSCGVCMEYCPAQALSPRGYDRQSCYRILQKNARVHTGYGSSYVSADGVTPNSSGSDVCGKCVANAPCAFQGFGPERKRKDICC